MAEQRIRDYLIERGIDPAIARYAEFSLQRFARRQLDQRPPLKLQTAHDSLSRPLGADVFRPRSVEA